MAIILSPEQCRAARALLGWTQAIFAKKARVAQKTIADFETGETEPRQATLKKMQAALEKAGVLFIPANGGGSGVRFAAPRADTKRK